MILTEEVYIKMSDKLSSDYIETELKLMGYDALRWSIIDQESDILKINVSFIKK